MLPPGKRCGSPRQCTSTHRAASSCRTVAGWARCKREAIQTGLEYARARPAPLRSPAMPPSPRPLRRSTGQEPLHRRAQAALITQMAAAHQTWRPHRPISVSILFRPASPGPERLVRPTRQWVTPTRASNRAFSVDFDTWMSVQTGNCVWCGFHARYKCARCLEVFYCDSTCQRAHWPRHEQQCEALPTGCPHGP